MPRPTTGVAYLILGLVLLGGLIFTVFVTIPAWSALAATRARLDETFTVRDERREFLANVGARLAELHAHERDARLLSVLFPETKQPADLAAVLQAAASRNGVAVITLSQLEVRKSASASRSATAAGTNRTPASPSPAAAEKEARSVLELRLTAQGTYAQLRGFLTDLERAPRFLDVVKIDVTPVQLEQGILKADITVANTLVESPQ